MIEFDEIQNDTITTYEWIFRLTTYDMSNIDTLLR